MIVNPEYDTRQACISVDLWWRETHSPPFGAQNGEQTTTAV